MGFSLAERQQVWLLYCGKKFEAKCRVRWCRNVITCFQFHVGHNEPKVKGGSNDLKNLVPICGPCNLGMGSKYTIDEWSNLHESVKKSDFRLCFRTCFAINDKNNN